MTPLSYRRIYRDFIGPEYPAPPTVVATVVRSMNEHAHGADPFYVRFRLIDGSSVTVRPRKRRSP